jgi:hypothetical protein
MAWEEGYGQLEPGTPVTERPLSPVRFPGHWQGAGYQNQCLQEVNNSVQRGRNEQKAVRGWYGEALSDARTKLAGFFTILLAVAFGEERETRRVTMEKVSSADRADFALREKPGEWNRAQPCRRSPGIMVGLTKEALASPATAEHQRTKRRLAMPCMIRRKQGIELLTG